MPGERSETNIPDATSTAGSQGDNPNKRRRVAIACVACRTRKSRCDGARPKCSLCTEFNLECIYSQSATSSSVVVGKAYLATLENRVNDTESKIRSFAADLHKIWQHVTTGGESSRRLEDPVAASGFPASGEQQEAAEDEAVDGMGAVIFADEEECGYFGPSSNIAFLRHISQAIARASKDEQPWTPLQAPGVDGGLISISRHPSPTSCNHPFKKADSLVNVYTLPSEEETMVLIRHYFRDTGFLFPYIHEDTFMQTYSQMRKDNLYKVRKSWLGLLNLIMAFAATTKIDSGVPAEERIKGSEVFYQRAVGLCQNQIMRGTSLEIVQYLLLSGQYLQGTRRSIQAWISHGLAVKAALQMGLHSNSTSSLFSPLERESRKRVWLGCVALDRTLSMTFGRPATIPESYVKLALPAPFPSESLSPGSINPDTDYESSASFFAATIQLYRIMWQIIDSLYGQNIGCDEPMGLGDTVSRLFTIEQQLLDWERRLPTSLRLTASEELFATEPGAESSDAAKRNLKLRNILTLRYLNLRILLHRPILSRFLDAHADADGTQREADLVLLQQIGSNSIRICTQSATSIINIVHAVLAAQDWRRGRLDAWWFTLYYVFNAALVIVAYLLACKSGTIAAGIMPTTTEVAMDTLKMATSALKILDRGNIMIERCWHYLEQLSSVVEDIVLGQDPESLGDPHHQTSAGTELNAFMFAPEADEFSRGRRILISGW